MLKRVHFCVLGLLGFAVSSAVGSIFQTASPYTDATGDQVGSTNKNRDISSVTITDDDVNLYITLNLNPGANLATGGAFQYGIGITSGAGAGGDLSTDSTYHGNPYKASISIDSTLGGMTDWIGLFGAGGNGSVATPYTSYGFNDYVYGTPGSSAPADTWTRIDQVSSGLSWSTQGSNTTFSSISLTVPLSDFASNLALTPGTTFDFDVYSTGNPTTSQTAYDSLADQSPTNSSNSGTIAYDGTVLDSYTISVPEPATLGLLGVGGLMLLKRRGRPRT